VQRAGTIVVEREQAHQAPVEVFGERVESEQALGVPDGARGVALHLKEAEQLFERLQVALAESLPLRQDPFIIAARQQVPAIQAVCLLKSDLEDVLIVLSCSRICERERLFELSDIEVKGRDGLPVYHLLVGSEEVFNFGKGLAQLVEQLAQVIASLGLGGLRLEKKGQVLALLGGIVMQDEIGEQGLQAHAVEACHLSISVDQAEIAEQSDVKGRLHRDLLDSRSSNERSILTIDEHTLLLRDMQRSPQKICLSVVKDWHRGLSQGIRRAYFGLKVCRIFKENS
jgi:hypothetical protein